MVVADDFLDTGCGNNHSVDSPNATVFEIGLWKERTIWGEELCAGDRAGLVVVEPGMLGTIRARAPAGGLPSRTRVIAPVRLDSGLTLGAHHASPTSNASTHSLGT